MSHRQVSKIEAEQFFAEISAWIQSDSTLSAKTLSAWMDVSYQLCTLHLQKGMMTRLLGIFAAYANKCTLRLAAVDVSIKYVAEHPILPNKDVNGYLVQVMTKQREQLRVELLGYYTQKARTITRVCRSLKDFLVYPRPLENAFGQVCRALAFEMLEVPGFGKVHYASSFDKMIMNIINNSLLV